MQNSLPWIFTLRFRAQLKSSNTSSSSGSLNSSLTMRCEDCLLGFAICLYLTMEDLALEFTRIREIWEIEINTYAYLEL